MTCSFLDTSAILNGALDTYGSGAIVSTLVLSELEHIKTSKRDRATKTAARKAIRSIMDLNLLTNTVNQKKIDKMLRKYPFLSNINDHRLLCEAELLARTTCEPIDFITSDCALYCLAREMPHIESVYYAPDEEENESEYCGWGKYYPSETQLAQLYNDPKMNVLGCRVNEFAEIFVDGVLKDVLCWTGQQYRPLKYKEFTSVLGEKVTPRNLEQKMYLDLLQNKEVPIKLCIANFGTGKSWMALTWALKELQNGAYDKIVFVKNNLEVRGAGQLGILPGNLTEKQLPWLRQIEDHVGPQIFEELLQDGRLEPAHLSTLRGRDLKNCIILVDEAENLLTTNIQLLLGRVAENSQIIFCADIKQCDYPFKADSGIPKMINRLEGNKLFGMVKLLKTERSVVAATADLLDG